MLIKFAKLIHRALAYGAVICLTGMVVVVAIQIVTRFVPGLSAPPWTEELARLLFVYTVAFGVGIGIRENAFPKLELLSNWLSEKQKWTLDLVVSSVVAVITAGLVYFGWLFTFNGASETSPSLGFSMSLAFFSMFLLLLLSFCYSVCHIVELCQNESES